MMQGNKKAAPVLQHQDGRVETGPASQAGPYLHQQSTTPPPPGQRVSDYLLSGQQNAVPLRHLKDLLHLDGRKVRLMIRAERLGGTPICEDSKSGYYLPQNADERDLCAKRLRHRSAQIAKVADTIAAADISGGDV